MLNKTAKPFVCSEFSKISSESKLRGFGFKTCAARTLIVEIMGKEMLCIALVKCRNAVSAALGTPKQVCTTLFYLLYNSKKFPLNVSNINFVKKIF